MQKHSVAIYYFFYIILVLKQGLIKVLRKYKIINSLDISERRATCVFVSMLINDDNLPSEVVPC